jgi:hypothetical protein
VLPPLSVLQPIPVQPTLSAEAREAILEALGFQDRYADEKYMTACALLVHRRIAAARAELEKLP